MKHVVIALALITASLPATAQDATEIARVQGGQSCPGCNLFQAELAYRDLKGIDVSGARLRQSDMQLSTFDDWNLSNTNLSIANMFGVRFNRSDFTGANLQRATMVGGYFGRSSFKNADLTDAYLSGADLSLARDLTQAQLDTACGDEETRLPKGLTIAHCAG